MRDNEQLSPEELQTPQLASLQSDDKSIVDNIDDNTVDLELSEEDQREMLIQQLKDSKNNFKPIKNYKVKTIGLRKIITKLGRVRFEKVKTIATNETTNPYGREFRKKRKVKNKQAKNSRRVNRK